MPNLQKVSFGAASDGSQGDNTRIAFTKDNANVDVLNTQATLTSFATTITSASALNAASHLGKRVNVNLATAGTINLPVASTCGTDGVILVRNFGTTLVTLAITSGSGDTVSLTALAAGESALMDTDGVHTWNCSFRGRSSSANEVVQGNCAVSGNESVGGTLQVGTASTSNGTIITGSGITVLQSDGKTAGATMSGSGNLGCIGTITGVTLNISGVSTLVGSVNVGGSNIGGQAGISVTGAYPFITRATGATAGYFWHFGGDNASSFAVLNQGNTGVYVPSGGTAWATASDERLKNIRSDLRDSLSVINDIRTVRYSWKIDDDHAEALGEDNESRVYVGVIAQDVQRHVPEAVSATPDGYIGVAYTDLVPLCMAAIKELSVKLDAANTAIAALQAKTA